MKNVNLFCALFLLLLSACSDSFQYDVFVKNSTGGDITVEFKTMKDKSGPLEDSVVLKDGEHKRIISTVDLAWSQKGVIATPKQCHQVADYVSARSGNIESKIKWCDENIHFSKEDIGQGRFTIEYIKSDFDL